MSLRDGITQIRETVFPWLESAATCAVCVIPVVGPLVNGIEAARKGDRVAVAGEAVSLVMDVAGLKLAKSSLRLARAASGSRRVLQLALKRKAKRKVREAVVKLGLTVPRLVADQVAQRHLKLRTFADAGSADARLHAMFALAAYLPHEGRRDLDIEHSGGRWTYTYLGGGAHRGFWACADNRHLLMAERGSDDAGDILPDLFLACGISSLAVGSRLKAAVLALMSYRQIFNEGWRVTATGHSLGGTLVSHMSFLDTVTVDSVHAFNPGGIPDVARLANCIFLAKRVKIHRITSDVVSTAFALGLKKRQQRVYNKKAGFSTHSAHNMVHFL